MKIALLSPFIHPIDEPFVGGTEAFISRFASALSLRGIDVVVYACEGSIISGVEIRTLGVPRGALVYPRSSAEMSGDEILSIRAYEDTVMCQVLEDVRHDRSLDLLHNHSFSAVPLFQSHLLPIPVVHTLHLPPMLPNMTQALSFCQRQRLSLQLVVVSQRQAQLWQTYYPVTRVIYNGFDVESFPFSSSHEGSLAFVGRMDPTKGIEDAIEVATRLGKHLDLYGAPQPFNTSYFETTIRPLLRTHPHVTYHGLVSQSTLFQGLCRAQALLAPVKWDEPFGNVLIEAMAVGTPVVMYNRGSACELIVEGISGCVVTPDNLEEMVLAVEQTSQIDRRHCARYAREHFSFSLCVDHYLELFQSVSSMPSTQTLG